MAEVHEYVVLAFPQEVSKEAQVETMAGLGDILKDFDGFKGRETFYSEADNRWVEHIVWENREKADASVQRIGGIPEALALFGKMDNSKTFFSFYEKIS